MMELFKQPDLLQPYLEAHSRAEDPVLEALSRHTWLKEVHPRMISGPVQGAFLELLSRLCRPSYIVEIGTYTGYSAICLARGLAEGGKMITIEINDELRPTAERFLQQAGLLERVELINGDALELIPTLDDGIDMVFIDALKEDYIAYYELLIGKIKPGGLILADNVLWGAKVLDPLAKDEATLSIRAFNQHLQADPRVNNVLLPLRDGIMICQKY